MAKKVTRAKLVKKLDVIFSKYIRLKRANHQGLVKCITCGKKDLWNSGSMHAGHFMSRRHYSTRWDEDNVQVQCCLCNTFREGEQYKFSIFLGKSKSKRLYLQSKKIVQFYVYELEEMISQYTNDYKDLLSQLDWFFIVCILWKRG